MVSTEGRKAIIGFPSDGMHWLNWIWKIPDQGTALVLASTSPSSYQGWKHSWIYLVSISILSSALVRFLLLAKGIIRNYRAVTYCASRQMSKPFCSDKPACCYQGKAASKRLFRTSQMRGVFFFFNFSFSLSLSCISLACQQVGFKYLWLKKNNKKKWND